MDGEPLQNTSLQPTPHMKMNLKKKKKRRRMKPKGPKHWCGPMFLGWTKEGTAKKEVFDAPHKDCGTVAESHKM